MRTICLPDWFLDQVILIFKKSLNLCLMNKYLVKFNLAKLQVSTESWAIFSVSFNYQKYGRKDVLQFELFLVLIYIVLLNILNNSFRFNEIKVTFYIFLAQ